MLRVKRQFCQSSRKKAQISRNSIEKKNKISSNNCEENTNFIKRLQSKHDNFIFHQRAKEKTCILINDCKKKKKNTYYVKGHRQRISTKNWKEREFLTGPQKKLEF